MDVDIRVALHSAQQHPDSQHCGDYLGETCEVVWNGELDTRQQKSQQRPARRVADRSSRPYWKHWTYRAPGRTAATRDDNARASGEWTERSLAQYQDSNLGTSEAQAALNRDQNLSHRATLATIRAATKTARSGSGLVRTKAAAEAEGQARTAVATAHTLPREPGNPMSAVCSICRSEDLLLLVD
jgi:hypothetical protein